MSRAMVQEYLTELSSIIIPKLQQYQQSRTRDSSMIRLGTLIDGEVRALQNSRWAIPIYNMPRIDAATVDTILKVFPKGTDPDVVCFDLNGTMNVEIQFQPIGRQPPPPMAAAAMQPARYYDLDQSPSSCALSSPKMMLIILVLSILAAGAYMVYSDPALLQLIVVTTTAAGSTSHHTAFR